MRYVFLKHLFVLMLVIASGASLMGVSQNVQRVEREVSRLDRAMESEKERVRILRAEWAYLNDPSRLEALATGGLMMQAPEGEDMVSKPDALPEREDGYDGRDGLLRDASLVIGGAQ